MKRSAKKIKANSPPLLFIAFFTSHRSPLSERLEQAKTSGGLRRREEKEGSYMRKRFSKSKHFLAVLSLVFLRQTLQKRY